MNKMAGLELLPPKQKEKVICQECNKEVSSKRKLIWNRVVKKLVCRKCNKKIGNNLWYNPNWKKENNRIGNYNITDEEKRRLHDQFVSEGCTDRQAWRKVSYHINILRKQNKKASWRRRQFFLNNKKKESDNAEQRKKFLEGLYGKQ